MKFMGVFAVVLLTTHLLAGAHVALAADSYEAAITAGTQLLEDKQYTEAREVLDAAIARMRAEEGGDKATLMRLLLPAARAHERLDDEKQGKTYFREAFELLDQLPAEQRGELAFETFSMRHKTVFGWEDSGRLPQLIDAFNTGRKFLDENDIRIASMATRLGAYYAAYRKPAEAREYLGQSYRVLGKGQVGDRDDYGAELLALGAAYIRIEEMQVADQLLKQAVAIGATTEEPIPIKRIAPVYPVDCLRSAIRGRVELQFKVDEKGRAHDPRVIDVSTWRGSGKYTAKSDECRDGMARAAKGAVMRFRYIPKLDNGVAAPTPVMQTLISFHVKKTMR